MFDRANNLCRVNSRRPCAICGKFDWCGYTPDERLAVCMRIAEGAIKATRNGGFLHLLHEDSVWRSRTQVRTLELGTGSKLPVNFGPSVAGYAAAVEVAELQSFAQQLGVSMRSLVLLGIGWAAEHRAWSFPMYEARRQVRGIRLRSWSGSKWSVRGSREGLFFPTGLDSSGPLLICEGPTDTAALLDLDFDVVGRPSCLGGRRVLCELVRHRCPPGVAIVADADEPGQRGAEALGKELRLYCRSVRVISPPGDIKDARAWKQAGATHEEVLAAIEAVPARSLRVTRRAKR